MGNFFNSNVALSSKKDDWTTPPHIFEKLNEEFTFTVDLCASDENHLCDRYYTEKRSCFDADLHDECIFCNPPYGRDMKKFIAKCYDLWQSGNTVVLLVPARTDTKWFHKYIYHNAEIRFIKGRLRFGNGHVVNNAPFASMICVFEKRR